VAEDIQRMSDSARQPKAILAVTLNDEGLAYVDEGLHTVRYRGKWRHLLIPLLTQVKNAESEGVNRHSWYNNMLTMAQEETHGAPTGKVVTFHLRKPRSDPKVLAIMAFYIIRPTVALAINPSWIYNERQKPQFTLMWRLARALVSRTMNVVVEARPTRDLTVGLTDGQVESLMSAIAKGAEQTVADYMPRTSSILQVREVMGGKTSAAMILRHGNGLRVNVMVEVNSLSMNRVHIQQILLAWLHQKPSVVVGNRLLEHSFSRTICEVTPDTQFWYEYATGTRLGSTMPVDYDSFSPDLKVLMKQHLRGGMTKFALMFSQGRLLLGRVNETPDRMYRSGEVITDEMSFNYHGFMDLSEWQWEVNGSHMRLRKPPSVDSRYLSMKVIKLRPSDAVAFRMNDDILLRLMLAVGYNDSTHYFLNGASFRSTKPVASKISKCRFISASGMETSGLCTETGVFGTQKGTMEQFAYLSMADLDGNFPLWVLAMNKNHRDVVSASVNELWSVFKEWLKNV